MTSPDPDRASERAREMLTGREGHDSDDLGAAEAAAKRILEESEARTQARATVDPDDEEVIRRSSQEVTEGPSEQR